MQGDYLGIPMLFIGMLLVVNALWSQGKCESKDAGVFNLIVGVLAAVSAIYFAWAENNVALGAGAMLFAITYLWVGVNAVRGATDQKALGYYCLLVAILTVPFSYMSLLAGDIGFAVEWLTYGALWYLFYQLLAVDNKRLTRLTTGLTYFVGIEVALTGWALLYGYWPLVTWQPIAN